MKYLMPVLILCSTLFSACASAPAISDDNLTSYDITIPGCQSSYEFLFITDTHFIADDDESDPQIKDYSSQRLSAFIAESKGNAVPSLDDWIKYANSKQLDGLLLGGDIIDSPAASNRKLLDTSLGKANIPYIYTLGNHDWTYPWDYMTESGKAKYLPLFKPYMKENTSIHSAEFDDFVIVAVDNSSNQIHPDALPAYKEILKKGKPVILLVHVPFYTESAFEKSSKKWENGVTLGGGIHGGIYPDAVSTEFINLTTAADSPVAAVIAGHIHLADNSEIPGEKPVLQIIGDAGYMGQAALLRIKGSESLQ